MTAIDATTGKIAATTVDLDGRTEHLAADGAGHVFLAGMQDRGTVLKLDARDFESDGDLAAAGLRPAEQHGRRSRALSRVHRLQERGVGSGECSSKRKTCRD